MHTASAHLETPTHGPDEGWGLGDSGKWPQHICCKHPLQYTDWLPGDLLSPTAIITNNFKEQRGIIIYIFGMQFGLKFRLNDLDNVDNSLACLLL